MTSCEFVLSGQSKNWQKSVFNSELQQYIKKYKRSPCVQTLPLKFALLCELYVSPSNLNNFILIKLISFLMDSNFFPICQSFLKLLVQEVEDMQFLLHKAACTKKLPDTPLSKNVEADGIFTKKNCWQAEKNAQKYCQHKFIRFSSLSHIMW